MQSIDFHIKGLAPIVFHNARLSDPLDPWTRAIAEMTSKRKKTEADLIEMARREFHGGMYTNAAGHPVVPGQNIEKMLRDAAAKTKQGKTVQAGLIVTDEAPLIYDGPKDIGKLWEHGGFALRASVGIGRQRVIRSRPTFPNWELKFNVTFDETIIKSAGTIREFLELAGRICGLCDWRPKYGRFEVL